MYHPGGYGGCASIKLSKMLTLLAQVPDGADLWMNPVLGSLSIVDSLGRFLGVVNICDEQIEWANWGERKGDGTPG